MTTLEEGFRALESAFGKVHDTDEGKRQVAVDFPFCRLDAYRTDFAPGWNSKYLQKHRPVMLVEHDKNKLIGRAIDNEQLGDRSRIIGQFSDFTHNPLAAQYYDHLENDEIPGWSYHFRNARAIAHPSERGARRYLEADMPEFGPTVFPAIPDAVTAGLRSEEATLEIPSLDTILAMKRDGVIGDAGVRSLIEEHHPHLVEHIVLNTPAKPSLVEEDGAIAESFRSAAADLVAGYDLGDLRAMTVHIGDDGAVSTEGGTVTNDGADNVQTLVQGIDACLDNAVAELGDMDVTSLPDNVQQAISLVRAAGVAVDELQNVLGIDDPDDPLERSDDDVDTSAWDFDASKYTPEQLKAACVVVDGDGSTKDQCHLPVRTPDGKLNKDAVHAAAGALAGARGGTSLSAADKKSAASKLMGLYEKIGDTPPASLKELAGEGSRSEELENTLAARFNLQLER